MTDESFWNWQRDTWPEFTHDPAALTELESEFLLRAGEFLGAVRHTGKESRDLFTIEQLSEEALQTSEIEGELLDRESVQSSLRRQFGLPTDSHRVPPAERGIVEMMMAVRQGWSDPLSDAALFDWHRSLMGGRSDLSEIGGYRSHESPMRVVSGPIHAPVVHFEGPPSPAVPEEMRRFITWFNESGPRGGKPLPLLTRAGTAHLYFESIHPFEDGNGRIGRALVEKALSQGVGQPLLTALSGVINARRKDYYARLAANSRSLNITDWLVWFAETIILAQRKTRDSVDFLIRKTRFLDGLRGRLNSRQERALLRVLREGPDGFQGGLSASNYISITGASQATATRDLRELLETGALEKTGELKGTRYWLRLPD